MVIRSFITVFMVVLGISLNVSAQEMNIPQAFDTYVEKYKQRFSDIREKYEAQQSKRPLGDILMDFSHDVGILETEFRDERREDYEGYRKIIVANQSCTSASNGKRKVCHAQTIVCPEDLKIMTEEVSVTGGGVNVTSLSADGVVWHVVKTGKGRNVGTASVPCVYEDRFISVTTNDELDRIKKLAGIKK